MALDGHGCGHWEEGKEEYIVGIIFGASYVLGIGLSMLRTLDLFLRSATHTVK